MKDSKLVNYSMTIAIQVLFVFIFLNVFFFVYVVKEEKKIFQKQIRIIISDMFNDQSIKSIINSFPNFKDTKSVMLGLLGIIKRKIEQSTSSDNKHIEKINNDIKKKSILLMAISTCVLSIIIMILICIGFKIPFYDIIKENLIILVFIGITEYIFLNLIAKRYRVINANNVRKYISDSVEKYIKNKS